MKKNYFYAAVTVVIWATTTVVVKIVLSNIPDMQALCVSSFLAFIFMLAVNIKTGSVKKMNRYSAKKYAVMAGLGFLGIFLYSVLYYYGIKQLKAQDACILNYLWPIMLVVFSCIILKERMTAMKIAALLCSFAGIVIMSVGTGNNAAENTIFGTVACILAAACYGLFSVLNKRADYDQNITMMVIWLVVAVCAAAFGLLTETWVPIHGTMWLGILWIGIVIDAVAYLLWALALSRAQDTAAIANMAYLTPLLSVVFSAVILKEKIQLKSIAALGFIVGGIALQSILERKSQANSVKKAKL